MLKTLYIPIDTTLDFEYECPLLVKKYDTLNLKLAVFDKGILKNLTGQTINLILRKSDGTNIEKTVTDITLNILNITLDKQATASSGIVEGELQIRDSNGQSTTNTFTYNVSNSLATDIEIKSKDDINTLQDMRALIATYKEEIQVLGSSVQATEALINIKNYIDNNLAALTNKNATASANIDSLKTENNRADNNIPGLNNLNDTAEEKLEEFRLYDTTELNKRVQQNTAQLSENMQQISDLDTNINLKAEKTEIVVERARIDNLIQTSSIPFYQKSISTDTGALLVVSTGATTGQINLANVIPLATGYTPVVGDYVRLVYGVASGSLELIDLRTGVNGKIYSSAGNAIRGQIETIGQELFETKTESLSLSFEAGSQFIDGTIDTSSGYYHVDIPVTNINKFNLTGYNFYSMPLYLLLDESDNIVSKFPETSLSPTKYSNLVLIPPSNSTILRVNYTTKIGGTSEEYKPVVSKEEKTSKVSEIKSNITQVENNITVIESTVVKNEKELFEASESDIQLEFETGSQFSNGTMNTTSGYYHVDLEIVENKKYTITGYNFYSMPLYLLLDESDNIVSKFPTSTSGQSKYTDIPITIPTNAKKLRVNYTTNIGGTTDEYKPVLVGTLSLKELININNDSESNPLSNIGKISVFTKIFKKIGIIGDSLSSGAQDISSGTTARDMVEYSWATFMGKIIGCDTVRLCQGGLQLQNWHTLFEAKARLTENKCTAYIIMLGHNDTSIETGEISDIDVSNPLNSSTTTQYGLYGKLIGTIKDIEPDAKIFCVTYPIYYVENYRTNNIARDCDTLFNNCYCIDLYKYDKYVKIASNTSIGTPNPMFAKVHGTVLGYSHWADEIVAYIDYIIKNNINDFIKVGYIGTGVSY